MRRLRIKPSYLQTHDASLHRLEIYIDNQQYCITGHNTIGLPERIALEWVQREPNIETF